MGLTRKQAESLGIGHLFPRARERRKPVPTGGTTIRLREAEPGDTGPWIVAIPAWIPPSLNRYLRKHWTTVSKAKERAKDAVAAACFADGLPRAVGKRRVSVCLVLPPGRRAPDEDNIGKALRDGLVACGALVDDGPEWCETGAYTIERGELGTRLTLEIVGDGRSRK